MSDFGLYLGLGFEHISDLQGYDHMVFLLALASVYRLADWRGVLIQVTAFTIGHSLTLALSTLQVVNLPAPWIEFFIPVTILLTAGFNLWFHKSAPSSRQVLNPQANKEALAIRKALIPANPLRERNLEDRSIMERISEISFSLMETLLISSSRKMTKESLLL